MTSENINKENALFAAKVLDDKKAFDIKIIDINGIAVFADYFVIATGNTPNHIQNLCNELEEKMHEKGVALKQIEGYEKANWVLMDFGDIIVHIFDKDNRFFYDLERIWADGKKIETDFT